MGITLMPYIPYQFIRGEVKDMVENDRQLYHPKVGGKMASGAGDGGENLFPDLFAEGGHFLKIQFFHVRRVPNTIQEFSH